MNLVIDPKGIKAINDTGSTLWEPAPKGKKRCKWCGSWVEKDEGNCPSCAGPLKIAGEFHFPRLRRRDKRWGIVQLDERVLFNLRGARFPFPDDTQIIGVWDDFERRALLLCLEHSDFREVPPGCKAPYYGPIWEMDKKGQLHFVCWNWETVPSGFENRELVDLYRLAREAG